MKEKFYYSTLLVTIVVVLCSVILFSVKAYTDPIIAANLKAKQLLIYSETFASADHVVDDMTVFYPLNTTDSDTIINSGYAEPSDDIYNSLNDTQKAEVMAYITEVNESADWANLSQVDFDAQLLELENGIVRLYLDYMGYGEIYLLVGVYDAEDNLIGVVYDVITTGYITNIEYAISISFDGDEIQGFKVIQQGETAGLGNKILEDPFASQFNGDTADSSLEVDYISGATRTSEHMDDSILGTVINHYQSEVKGAN